MNKEIEIVFNLPGHKRYEYFIKKVADNGVVWGLYDNGYATLENENLGFLIPFWPRKEFAVLLASEEWKGYDAEELDVMSFIVWLEEMKNGEYKPAIFMNDVDSVVLDIDILIKDLKDELENY